MANAKQGSLFPMPKYDIRLSHMQLYISHACEVLLEEIIELCRKALGRGTAVSRNVANLNYFLVSNLPKSFVVDLDLDIDRFVRSGEKKQRKLWFHGFMTELLVYLNKLGYISYNKGSGLVSVLKSKVNENTKQQTQLPKSPLPLIKSETKQIPKNQLVSKELEQQIMKLAGEMIRENRSYKAITESTLANWGLSLKSLGYTDCSDISTIPIPKNFEWQVYSFATGIISLRYSKDKTPVEIFDEREVIVDSSDRAASAKHIILQCKTLSVDLEGELRADGEVWTIQFAFADPGQTPKAFLFDLLCPESQPVIQVAKEILEQKSIRKIFHDCRRDNEALLCILDITVENVVDTQVMFGLCNKVKTLYSESNKWKSNNRISLNDLLAYYNCPVNTSKTFMHDLFDDREAFHELWKKRPLDKKVISYACEDVLFLGEAYHKLMDDLQEVINLAGESLTKVHLLTYTPGSEVVKEKFPVKYIKFSKECNVHYFLDPSEELPESERFVLPATPFCARTNDEEFDSLLQTLPISLREAIIKVLKDHEPYRFLVEIKIDRGRFPALLYSDDFEEHLTYHPPVDINVALEQLANYAQVPIRNEDYSTLFTSDRRMGLPEMLHRISVIQDRRGRYNGLTYRIGRHFPGVVEIISDFVRCMNGNMGSLLLLGPPGVGKTTLLRSIIQLLSVGFRKRVVIVDTSNEIAGDGDVPHACIGFARRIEVPNRKNQHQVLIEAVQNHNPQIIVVDEIGNSAEVAAAKTISQRGVAMIGTAHGSDLISLLHNPELNSLIGGVCSITIGDSEMNLRAKQSGGPKKKNLVERAGAPIFDSVIEIVGWNCCRLFKNTKAVVDAILSESSCLVEDRWVDEQGNYASQQVRYPVTEGKPANFHWFDQLCKDAKTRIH